MFLQKVFAKIHPKKKKIWKWALAVFVALAIIGMIFIRLAIGELGELGIFKVSGFPTAKNYLIIFQNDAERRPTGGFITSFATLRFRAGIPLFEFGNVYDEKLIQKGSTPPSEIMSELLAGDFYPGHGFRDGNFDADFPTTAKELIRLYELGFPDADFDGVIAIDFTAFENLTKKLNPSLIGAVGLFSQIENKVQNIDLHNPEEINSRKNFLAGLAKNLIKKSFLHPKTATKSLLESLNSKHLLFYFRDLEIQETVQAKNWGGTLNQKFSGDFLAINEGNYGGMKSSRYLVRDIFYDVEFIENQFGELTPSSNLKISLEHRGDAAEPISGYYKSFWRIFTPIGSIKNSGKVDQSFDDGFHQVFGEIIKMNPGEKREIALNYDLPAFVMQYGVYKLKLVKQSGSGSDFVRVTVKLPAGFLLASEDFETKENLAIFQTLLDSDKELELKILPDETPPRLAWQEFIGKNLRTIDLRFNEALDYESVAAAKFSLADMNYRNKRFDSVAIQRVRFIPPQNIRLDVSGVTPECREWYELRFSGISDKQGNTIEDGKITVVQWINEFGQNCDPNREL